MPVTPVFFAPDIDTSWDVNPGAIAYMAAMAPLQSGYYGTVSGLTAFQTADVDFPIVGNDILAAYMFRAVAGTVRFLVFRSTGIDEYTVGSVRTSRVSGLTTSTEWSAAAWGDQIIACNLNNSTQSSTGGNFSALSGAPKARHIAANLNFVMLADTDDGVTPYKDEVYWSGIYNPNTWTTSIATQCGRQRLLDSPGPITALVALRDQFIAFKDNSMFVGDYVGVGGQSSFIFQWRCISQRIGCVGPKAVCELDGKLYFLHQSGFYQFDGQVISNVGLQCFQSFLSEAGVIWTGYNNRFNPQTFATSVALSATEAVADEFEGVVWFKNQYYVPATPPTTGPFAYTMFMYGYNVRCQKWGRHTYPSMLVSAVVAGANAPLVRATAADIQTFRPASGSVANVNAIWLRGPDSLSTFGAFAAIMYPATNGQSSPYASTYTTGAFGVYDRSVFTGTVYVREIAGTTTPGTTTVTGSLNGYQDESFNTPISPVTMTYNTELQALNGNLDARFKTVTVTYGLGTKHIVAALGPQFKPAGTR
jgi:hypothetical protein